MKVCSILNQKGPISINEKVKSHHDLVDNDNTEMLNFVKKESTLNSPQANALNQIKLFNNKKPVVYNNNYIKEDERSKKEKSKKSRPRLESQGSKDTTEGE